jgi:transcriptional regulator with XRE-family HTH domain
MVAGGARRYACVMHTSRHLAGELLREWRTRRRLSQLDLASEAGISQRHLSFVESGRALPSREMLLHLAEELQIPLRERNRLLVAAGYAPSFPEHRLDEPELAAARAAVDAVLKGHEPFPALAVDRHWQLLAANAAVPPLLAEVEDRTLLSPPVNVLRLSLHPRGLAPAIVNLEQWRGHLLERLQRQIDATADPELIRLERELLALPRPRPDRPFRPALVGTGEALVAIPLRLRRGPRVLSFISTTTVFGTPVDVTLAELAVEAFFPADPETAAALGVTPG